MADFIAKGNKPIGGAMGEIEEVIFDGSVELSQTGTLTKPYTDFKRIIVFLSTPEGYSTTIDIPTNCINSDYVYLGNITAVLTSGSNLQFYNLEAEIQFPTATSVKYLRGYKNIFPNMLILKKVIGYK